MARQLTGKHVAAIICAFFGVVISVNAVMAVLATRTFGGTVVDNSYVASQKFNGWLAEARAQRALGWRAGVSLDSDRRALLSLSKDGLPLAGAAARGYARHPLGRAPDVSLVFDRAAPGRLVSRERLPAGRWYLHLLVTRGPERADLIAEAQ